MAGLEVGTGQSGALSIPWPLGHLNSTLDVEEGVNY